MNLRERVQALKKAAGMNTDTLSKLSGVPKGTINKILNGETTNPRGQTLNQLARALGCSPEALYGQENGDNSSAPVAAGSPISVYGEAAPAHLPAYDFALRASGDAMIGARIHDGDLVLIQRAPAPADGEIAAVVVDAAPVLAHLYRIEGGITLVSENPAYPPRVITGDELTRVEILGRAVALIGAL